MLHEGNVSSKELNHHGLVAAVVEDLGLALTAFGFAVLSQRRYEEDFTVLEYLIEAGADINAPCMISKQFRTGYQHVGYGSILKWGYRQYKSGLYSKLRC